MRRIRSATCRPEIDIMGEKDGSISRTNCRAVNPHEEGTARHRLLVDEEEEEVRLWRNIFVARNLGGGLG